MKKRIFLLAFLSLFILVGCEEVQTENETGNQEQVEKNYDDNQVVKFNDTTLEQIIREKVSKETEDILASDMKEIYALSLNNREGNVVVKDLTGLEYAINLESISILYNNIKSLNPLKNLQNLSYINVSYGSVEEAIDLGNLPSIRTFNLTDIAVNSISFMKNFTTLESTILSRCGLTDISALTNLSNLTTVNLYGNSISDISALANKPKLESLNLQGNQVTDISPLSTDTSLITLVLSYNHVSDLSAIMNLENLEELRIYEELDAKIASRSQLNELSTRGVEVYYHE